MLLSSTSDLVHLELGDIPQGGYILPDAMVVCLGGSNTSASTIRIRLYPALDRVLLPACITDFATYNPFSHGDSEYVEELHLPNRTRLRDSKSIPCGAFFFF